MDSKTFYLLRFVSLCLLYNFCAFSCYHLHSLDTIQITANKLITEIDGLGSFKNLTVLQLNNNNISNIEGLNKLKNLKFVSQILL